MGDNEKLRLSKEEQKEVVKQAIQEWLDAQFANFGKYSLAAILSACLGVMLYIWLMAHSINSAVK